MDKIKNTDLDALFEALNKRGYKIVGPTIKDEAIVYDRVNTSRDLPVGYTDRQGAGFYRIKKRRDRAFFGYVVGPHSWKKYLHKPLLTLFSAQKNGKNFEINALKKKQEKFAFLGVRACELNAITIQDKVFMGGEFRDQHYTDVRKKAFIIAVNCTQAGANCFCVSMETGPKADAGFDLALTEVIQGKQHYFIAEAGSKIGTEVLSEIPREPAAESEIKAAARAVKGAETQMGKTMDTTEIKDLLYRNPEHPRWDEVASRCLSCANCTMVCPTCFCTTVEDVTDLTGESASRVRKWDSCFHKDFSYIHGGNVRFTPKARYRQWLTHKLASWQDQFGTSGCVGCGRCITWCPVGIDITEEVRAIRATEQNSN